MPELDASLQPADAETQLLDAALPSAGNRVLARGLDCWPGLERWRRAGLEVSSPVSGSPEKGVPFDAIVHNGLDQAVLDHGLATELSEQLVDRGRLLILDNGVAGGELGADPALHCLYAAGFVLLKEHALPHLAPLLPGGSENTHPRLLVLRKDDFTVRSVSAQDGESILRLFASCFHADRQLEHWRWKYEDNPYGRGMVSLVWSPESQLVCHYAGYPVPLHAEPGAPTLAVQMGDTMTAPELRGVGRRSTSLLRRAVEHFFATYSDPRVAIYYGFNTGSIRRFSLRFVRGHLLEPVTLRRRGVELPGSGGYRVVQLSKADASLDRFFARHAPAYGNLVRRDSTYLQWRYLDCPDVSYLLLTARRWGRLVGWSSFRRVDDRLLWGDAMLAPRHAGAAADLLRTALSHPQMQGVKTVEAWFPDRPHWWHQQLLTLGFQTEEEPNDLALIYRRHGAANPEPWLNQLYYTWGDSDLF